MKSIVFLLFFGISLVLNSCESNDYYGYDWKKDNVVLKVPVASDSLLGDTLNVRILTWYMETEPDIIYSPTIDSFIITADIKGMNFSKPGADTLWKPGYEYEWHSSRLTLNYLGRIMKIQQKNSQTPQVPPPQDEIRIERMRIEVPKSVKYINRTWW